MSRRTGLDIAMIRVNERLGYRPDHTEVVVESDLGAIEALLGSGTDSRPA
ncbi:hypothetical protein ABH931_002256 [Streptacidiphilus sp. MAP12-33]